MRSISNRCNLSGEYRISTKNLKYNWKCVNSFILGPLWPTMLPNRPSFTQDFSFRHMINEQLLYRLTPVAIGLYYLRARWLYTMSLRLARCTWKTAVRGGCWRLYDISSYRWRAGVCGGSWSKHIHNRNTHKFGGSLACERIIISVIAGPENWPPSVFCCVFVFLCVCVWLSYCIW